MVYLNILPSTFAVDTISGQQYCVAGPLALWHIDGNHKLIK